MRRNCTELYNQDLGTTSYHCVIAWSVSTYLVISQIIERLHCVPVAGYHWLQHYAPAIGAVHVAPSHGALLDIAELVEHERRMIAGAAEMPVVGAAFLVAVGRALARSHVEHDLLRRSPMVYLVDPLTGKIGQTSKVLGSAQPLVSNLALAEADDACTVVTDVISGRPCRYIRYKLVDDLVASGLQSLPVGTTKPRRAAR